MDTEETPDSPNTSLNRPFYSVFVFTLFMCVGYYEEPEGQVFVEYSLREIFEVMLIPTLWLGLTGWFIWRKPHSKFKVVLLLYLPVAWVVWAYLAAYPGFTH